MKILFTICIMLVITPVFGATPSGPEMRLFPTTILDDIKQTARIAEEMEHSLQDVIARLDLNQQLYVESRCEGADGDPGCERIKRQLGAAYLEMLEGMSNRLPEMEKAVNNALEGVENQRIQLSIEIGDKIGDNRLLLGLLTDVYLDLEQASYLIAATRQAIARATLIEQPNQSFGEISPEMSEIIRQWGERNPSNSR